MDHTLIIRTMATTASQQWPRRIHEPRWNVIAWPSIIRWSEKSRKLRVIFAQVVRWVLRRKCYRDRGKNHL